MDETTLKVELAQVRSSLARLAAKANCIASQLHEIARTLAGSWGIDEQIELLPEEFELIRTDTSLTLERSVVDQLLGEIADLRRKEFGILRQLGPSKSVRRAKSSETADPSSAGARLPRRRAKCAGDPSFAREAE